MSKAEDSKDTHKKAKRPFHVGHVPARAIQFFGLAVFIALLVLIILWLRPYFADILGDNGPDRMVADIRSAGAGGVMMVLAIQFLQIIVAFIPGELVQMAAGIIYGPVLGSLIIFVGCVISSCAVYLLVHIFGAPFVQSMIPQNYMEKFRQFERSGKFEIALFVLFLIPGLPKDVFTYITPLTHIKLLPFLLITNFARIPGIVVSTYAASGLIEGRVWESVILFIGLALVSAFALLAYNKLAGAVDQRSTHHVDRLNEIDNGKGRQ